MDFILRLLDLSWKILCLYMGWTLFKYVLKNGKDTFKDLLDTMNLLIRAIGIKVRKCTREYLQREKIPKKEPGEKEEPQDKSKEPIDLTFEEWENFKKFNEAMQSGRPFVLK